MAGKSTKNNGGGDGPTQAATRAGKAREQAIIMAQSRRMRLARPQSEAELRAVIDAAIARGVVTICPPAAASVPVNCGLGFDPAPKAQAARA